MYPKTALSAVPYAVVQAAGAPLPELHFQRPYKKPTPVIGEGDDIFLCETHLY